MAKELQEKKRLPMLTVRQTSHIPDQRLWRSTKRERLAWTICWTLRCVATPWSCSTKLAMEREPERDLMGTHCNRQLEKSTPRKTPWEMYHSDQVHRKERQTYTKSNWSPIPKKISSSKHPSFKVVASRTSQSQVVLFVRTKKGKKIDCDQQTSVKFAFKKCKTAFKPDDQKRRTRYLQWLNDNIWRLMASILHCAESTKRMNAEQAKHVIFVHLSDDDRSPNPGKNL